MDSLSPQQREFLEINGYLIIKGLLDSEKIRELKHRLIEIRRHEGPRVGEYGYSKIREDLIKQNSNFRLWGFDLFYTILKFICSFLPLTRISIQSKSAYYNGQNSWKIEIRQMLIAIREQFDSKDQRICDLVNKGEVFSIFYRHPLILEAVKNVVGEEFKLSSLNIRSPKRNNNPQDMHVDWPWAVGSDESYACNALWLLDDMDESNGPTRLIPGSHKWAKIPSEGMQYLKSTHPKEIQITAKAGDVLFLNSHIWHGGTTNITGNPRAIVQSYYVHKAHPSQQVQRNQIRSNTFSYLNDEDLRVLDILGD
ncbi:phytanoyl-CoA dioxygenase family protein [Roseivirga echinicomitans]|uniref:Phytanoyl-CoA dioxygenase n=1 Tax=Roseivirga echinicomitans TaxID=296218 RepID=A0A150XQ05_9BACT|nr:phytanoyl-CoA dioxygenase family protein [Roseivirga echinicomitans]KYG80784.1 hypothetical protein AWN68_16905 [Roseivirga echinicomitans]